MIKWDNFGFPNIQILPKKRSQYLTLVSTQFARVVQGSYWDPIGSIGSIMVRMQDFTLDKAISMGSYHKLKPYNSTGYVVLYDRQGYLPGAAIIYRGRQPRDVWCPKSSFRKYRHGQTSDFVSSSRNRILKTSFLCFFVHDDGLRLCGLVISSGLSKKF